MINFNNNNNITPSQGPQGPIEARSAIAIGTVAGRLREIEMNRAAAQNRAAAVNQPLLGGQAAQDLSAIPKGAVSALINQFSANQVRRAVSNNTNAPPVMKEASAVLIENTVRGLFKGQKSDGLLLGNEKFKGTQRMMDAHDVNLEELGKGNFKITYQANLSVDNVIKKMAVTTFNINESARGIVDGKNLGLFDRIVNEHELNMANLIFSNHLDNVIPGGTLLNPATGDAFIVTKYGNSGTIDKGWGSTTTEEKSKLLLDMATGKKALHDAGVSHRDWKPGNIVLHESKTEGKTAYVIDFGCSVETTKGRFVESQNHGLFSPYKKHHLGVLEQERSKINDEIGKLPEKSDRLEKLENDLEKIDAALLKIDNDPAEDSFAFGLAICQLVDQKNEVASGRPWIRNPDPINPQGQIENYVNQTFGEKGPLKDLVMKLVAYDPSERLSDQALIDALTEISLDDIEHAFKHVADSDESESVDDESDDAYQDAIQDAYNPVNNNIQNEDLYRSGNNNSFDNYR